MIDLGVDVRAAHRLVADLGRVTFRVRQARNVPRDVLATRLNVSLSALKRLETEPGYDPRRGTVLALLDWLADDVNYRPDQRPSRED